VAEPQPVRQHRVHAACYDLITAPSTAASGQDRQYQHHSDDEACDGKPGDAPGAFPRDGPRQYPIR
jgi:hypothetical protein